MVLKVTSQLYFIMYTHTCAQRLIQGCQCPSW